jgi:PKD repeat protein
VVDYDDGIYAVGTSNGDLYVINESGEYTVTHLGDFMISDVRIKSPFIAVAANHIYDKGEYWYNAYHYRYASFDYGYVIKFTLSGLTPNEQWRTRIESWGYWSEGTWDGMSDTYQNFALPSVDLSSDGNYVAYLSHYDVGVLRGSDGTPIASYSISGAFIVSWLDATDDMEYIAITAEVGPYYWGENTGVELYRFDGMSLNRVWGTILIYRYETTEVKISEDKRYVAVATSSGTEMNLLDLATGSILWRYDATQEQFAVDGDRNLNYIIGATQYDPYVSPSPPYKWFIIHNLGTTFEVIAEGNMNGPINDLDSNDDASLLVFGSDAGEVILLRRVSDSIETVYNFNVERLIDSIEIGTNTFLVGGENFVHLYLRGALNQPPVAKFNFSPSEPKAGEQIIFDPSLSYDPDGKIVSYEWDWDSDGNYEVYTGSPLTIIFWWPEPGEYRVGLKVTDDKGAVSITCKNIVIRQSAKGEANAILVGYFDWLHQWWWENHKNFVTIDTWLRDFMPGSETLDWLKGTKFAWCKEADVVYVFNKEIDPSLAPGLTYKIHILNTIYEEELVNEAWRQITPTYEILKEPVRKLISRSIWSLPQKLGEQAILDLAPELGVGISTILLVSKIHGLVDMFNEVDKVTYILALGAYFRGRLQQHAPDEAWDEASLAAKLAVKEELLLQTKWYFEELWLKYKGYGWPYVGLLTSVREDIRAKVKELLLSALEKYKNELPNRKRANIASIAELRVYDAQGRVTGLVNGEVREEIPNSVYDNDTRMVEIFLPTDQYTYEVVGKAEEMYGLEIVSIENGESIIFNAVDIPISANVVHRYIIDWSTLSAGGEGVILQIDSNGDGIFEKSLTSDNELNHDEFVLQTATTIDFDPDTLNLASKGKVVTVYIELPADYSLNQIDISSIKINNTVFALKYPFEINDYDYDGIPELMVKFDRASVIALFSGMNIPGNYVIEVTGKWKDICFKANTTIRVISLP